MPGRGRILRASEGGLQAVAIPPSPAGRARRLSAAEVGASERARTIVADAERRAALILAEAERAASEARLRAEEAGRIEGLASVAAVALRLQAREEAFDERAIDRVVELARLLAERIIGQALSDSPERVVDLAHRLLHEAGGARRIRLHAHPDDATLLGEALAEFDPDGRVHAIDADPTLNRGDLRLDTDVGIVHAEVGVQIERLAERLRQVLRR
jgi:type III secretion system HrpE/YscL family protein